MAVGVGGILYPPSCLDKRAFDINKIQELCIGADDIWLKCISTIQTYKKYKKNIDTNQTQILAISVALQTFCLVYGLTGNFLYDRVFFVYSFGIVLYSYTANALLRERDNALS